MNEKYPKQLSAAFYGIVLFLVIALTAGPVLAQATPAPVFRLGWGSTGSGDLQFQSNQGIEVHHFIDGLGNPYTRVYVADKDNNRIQIFDENGAYVGSRGSGELYLPYGVDVDEDGNIFVADTYDHEVVRYSAVDNTYIEWGNGRGSGTNPVQFNQPSDLAVFGSGTSLIVYVADTSNNRVLKLTYDATAITTFTGTPGKAFYRPTGIDVDAAGNVYVSDTLNHRIVKISADGASVSDFAGTTAGSGNGQFNQPNGITVDGAGNVYIADTGNDRIQKLNPAGVYQTQWNSGSGLLNSPYGVAAWAENEVYVSDTVNNRIQVYEANSAPTALTIDTTSIIENRPVGTLVGTFSTTDANTGETQNHFTYQLVSVIAGEDCSGNSSFNIDGRMLETSVLLDYDVNTSHSICVRTTDSGGLYTETSMLIEVTQELVPPEFANAAFTQNEYTTNTADATRAEANDVIGTLTATDQNGAETITFTIESVEPAAYAGAFKIANPTQLTAQLQVNDPTLLNYEALTPDHRVTVTVKATDNSLPSGLSNTADITVNLADLNDPPVITMHPPAPDNYFSVNENTSSGTLAGYIEVTDEDLPADSITVSESFSQFAINLPPTTPGQYTIRVTAGLDYETITTIDGIGRYRAGNINVNDGAVTTSVVAYRIYIKNVNEGPTLASACSVSENTPLGGLVNGCATDPENDTIIYEKVLDESGGAFDVNAQGQFIVSNPSRINYETMGTNKYYYITLRVHDNVNPGITNQRRVRVNVQDFNEDPPELNIQSFTIPENSATNTTVGQVTLVAGADLDPRTNSNQYTYSFPDSTTCPYSITPQGLIRVSDQTKLNYEDPAVRVCNIAVKVVETGPADLEDTDTFTITLTNVNDPIKITLPQTYTVNEEVPSGTLVDNVRWTDDDAGTQPTFAKTGGTGFSLFEINAITGAITVAAGVRLDYENATMPHTFTLLVTVTDNAVPTPLRDENKTITINMINVNDPPVLAPKTFSALPENSPIGTNVSAVNAVDPNSGDIVSYSIIGGTGAPGFTIDSVSGMISVKDSTKLDYETAQNHQLTVIVRAQDNIDPPATWTHTYTIPLSNVNELPVVENTPFFVVEDSAVGKVVGTINAYDPEDGKTDILLQVTGDGLNAFNVNTTTGVITVKNRDMMDAGVTYTLNVIAVNRVPNPDESSPSTPITITVTPKADPGMVSMLEPFYTNTEHAVLSGTKFPYLITIKNFGNGPSDPITLWITMPNGFAFDSGTGCLDLGGGKVECKRGSMTASQSHTFTVWLKASSGLSSGITATFEFDLFTAVTNDTNLGNNSSSDTFKVYEKFVIPFDFASGTIPTGWSAVDGAGSPITVPWDQTPTGSNGFLGQLSSSTVTYQKSNLPYHNYAEVTFDLYIIKTWDGNHNAVPDVFKFITNQAPGQELTLLDTSFSNWRGDLNYPQCYPSNCPNGNFPPKTDAFKMNTLGYSISINGEWKPNDSTYRITYKFDHSNLELILKFIGENLQVITDESWGIDNVNIVITGANDNKVFLPMVKRP